MMPGDFHFLRPAWLLALVPLLYLLWRLARRRQGNWAAVCDPALLPHLLLPAGGGAPALAAGVPPPWRDCSPSSPSPGRSGGGSRSRRIENRSGLVVVLDLSAAIDAADLKPSRLARARFEIADLLERAARRADRPRRLCRRRLHRHPPDHRQRDDRLAAGGARQRPDAGAGQPHRSRPRTRRRLAAAGGAARRRRVAPHRRQRCRSRQNRRRGPATAAGRLPPFGARRRHAGRGADSPRRRRLSCRRRGSVSPSRPCRRAPCSSWRQRGAGSTGGCAPTTATCRRCSAFFSRHGGDATQERTAQHLDVWQEEGPWLLLPLLLLAPLGFRRGVLGVLFCLLLLPRPAQALDWQGLWSRPERQASRALARGETTPDAELFHDPAWKGAALYRAGRYQEALQALEQAGGETGYNRGNALARLGRYEEAAAAYRQALEADPENEDARHNLELVEKELQKQKGEQPQEKGDSSAESANQDSPPQDGERRGAARRQTPRMKTILRVEVRRRRQKTPRPPTNKRRGKRTLATRRKAKRRGPNRHRPGRTRRGARPSRPPTRHRKNRRTRDRRVPPKVIRWTGAPTRRRRRRSNGCDRSPTIPAVCCGASFSISTGRNMPASAGFLNQCSLRSPCLCEKCSGFYYHAHSLRAFEAQRSQRARKIKPVQVFR